MTNLSPLSWRVYENQLQTILDAEGNDVASTKHRGMSLDQDIANAERIVVCVNFLKDVDTELLEWLNQNPDLREYLVQKINDQQALKEVEVDDES